MMKTLNDNIVELVTTTAKMINSSAFDLIEPKSPSSIIKAGQQCGRVGPHSDSTPIIAPASRPARAMPEVPMDLRPFPAPDEVEPEEAEGPGEPGAADPPRRLEDLFKGVLPEKPWQHQRYDADNKGWQAAAMRKRAHYRRTNVSLGLCTVGLSGPS